MNVRVVKVEWWEVQCDVCGAAVGAPYLTRGTAERAVIVAEKNGHDCPGPEGVLLW